MLLLGKNGSAPLRFEDKHEVEELNPTRGDKKCKIQMVAPVRRWPFNCGFLMYFAEVLMFGLVKVSYQGLHKAGMTPPPPPPIVFKGAEMGAETSLNVTVLLHVRYIRHTDPKESKLPWEGAMVSVVAECCCSFC